MNAPGPNLSFKVNGAAVALSTDPRRRLADVLREDLGLTGTKIGCNAGDCGACTVLLDGRQVCACLVPVGQVADRAVDTVEGLARGGALNDLQQAFLRHGAAQCGICTPGMLMAATDLLAHNTSPDEAQVLDALGGVLCRCTGYRKIVEAVLDVAGRGGHNAPVAGCAPVSAAVGARMAKVDGVAKITGVERFGADEWPADALVLRAVRSPHHRARFRFGDFAALHLKYPGLARVLTAKDIPGQNLYGIYPTGEDQPRTCRGHVRYRGEAVAALVGDAATIATIRDSEIPITWETIGAVVRHRRGASRRGRGAARPIPTMC